MWEIGIRVNMWSMMKFDQCARSAVTPDGEISYDTCYEELRTGVYTITQPIQVYVYDVLSSKAAKQRVAGYMLADDVRGAIRSTQGLQK